MGLMTLSSGQIPNNNDVWIANVCVMQTFETRHGPFIIFQWHIIRKKKNSRAGKIKWAKNEIRAPSETNPPRRVPEIKI